MTTLRLGFTNLIDAASLTAGSEVAGLPATNLQDPIGSPSVAWQTLVGDLTTADGANLVGYAGYTATINGFAIARSNLSSTAQVLWRVWQSADMMDDSLAYSTGWISAGVVPTIGQHVHVAPSDVIGRYFRLDIHDPLNADGFINIPLIYIGPLWVPSVVELTRESTQGHAQGGTTTTTRGGQVRISLNWVAREWNAQLQFITNSEMESRALPMDRLVRYGGNVLFIPNVESTDINRQAIFGIATPTAPFGFTVPMDDARSWAATITERL